MLRGTVSKAMWVGRGAAAVFGLALVGALVLGAATMALAAVPGDPFRLGQTNGIDQISTLVGNAATPMLRIDNGSTAAGATALDLRVEAGKPPMRVNSAIRVPNLNADEVDGKEATDFYAAGSKVADSSHADQADQADSATSAGDAKTLDGKDASEFAAAYERTVVVSPVGTNNIQNGQALLDALASITDASASKPYLLYVEPETYDLGDGSLTMKPFVDIEGSGELNTVITSDATSEECFPQHPGTVNGANNAEMRFLTVRNTGTGVCSSAIFNKNDSPRLTHVTVGIRGSGDDIHAVWNDNSFPTMTDVTATASGTPNFAYAVFDNGSSPTMTDVTATASGGGAASYGVFNQEGSSPTIIQSELSGTSDALAQTGGGSSKVALSQLGGGVSGGPVQCFNNYNANLAAVTCP